MRRKESLKFIFYSLLKFLIVVSVFIVRVEGGEIPRNPELLRDFKATLMHFSEPFLRGVNIDDYEMEGDNKAEMAKTIIQVIEDLSKEGYRDLDKFKEALSAGIEITDEFDSAAHKCSTSGVSIVEYHETLKQDAIEIKESILKKLKDGNQLIIPSGWKRHAIALILKETPEGNHFDLTVVNTGSGIEYHFNSEDPNGVYPVLSQVWVEMKDIPKDVIFSQNAWFIQALILLKLDYFVGRLGKDHLSFYFYNVILANFSEYAQSPDKDKKELLMPMQRSGSCTLSSLLGAIFYLSDSVKQFYVSRLKIGHSLMTKFLDKAENDRYFEKIISDGQHIQGRNLFKGLASSSALQALQYLEAAFPENFNQAGLIGSVHSEWLFKDKEGNLDMLKSSPEAFENIKATVKICKRVTDYLEKAKIKTSTNEIIITDDFRSKIVTQTSVSNSINRHFRGHDDSLMDTGSELTKIINETPNRYYVENLDNFDNLYNAMYILSCKQFEEKDMPLKYFKFLDIFKFSFNGKIEKLKEIIGQVKADKKDTLLDMLRICGNILYNMGGCNRETISYEELLMLAVLQRLSWELTVAYDNLLEDPNKIGFEDLLPPKTLQSVMEYLTLLNYHKSNLLNNLYDFQNYLTFQDFIKIDSGSVDKERLKGPEEYFKENYKITCPENYRKIDLKMMSHPDVEAIWSEKPKTNGFTNLQDLEENEFKFRCVLTNPDFILTKTFKHYYQLMGVLSIIRQCALLYRVDDASLTWIKVDKSDSKILVTPFQIIYRYSASNELYTIHEQNNGGYVPSNVFFALFNSKISGVRLTNFEAWLNYVKDAKSSSIFESYKFQKITDRVLNVPGFKFDEETGEVQSVFSFDSKAAHQAISELTRLINMTLVNLKDPFKKDLPYHFRQCWAERSVHISVLMTRFISRVDSENILTGEECANLLAKVYDIILQYTEYDSNIGLKNAEISRLNFALSHICSIKIRNPLTFMQKINLNIANIDNQPIQRYRKTLERYHWFVAKTNFVTKVLYTSKNITDDQYKYGIIESPITSNETGFLQELFKSYFLKSLTTLSTDPEDFDIFKYHKNGYSIKISSSKSEEFVILNLATGKIIQNGLFVMDPTTILYSSKFINFFKNDLRKASKGAFFKYADKYFYYLPDFKGNSYLVYRKTYDELIFYRKWNDLWYRMINPLNDFKETDFNYQCTETSNIFVSHSSNKRKLMLFFRDDEKDPLIQMESDFISAGKSTVNIEISGFTDKKWQVARLDGDKSERNTHLEMFDPLANIAKTEDGRIVIICTGYRLSEDLKRPLILSEKEKTGDIEPNSLELLNIAEMKVCIDQSLFTNSSLLGTLVIEKDEKKFLLVPLMQRPADSNYREYKFIQEKDDIVQIKKIPLIKEVPAPQSRLDRLLLGYLFMWNHNYDVAKEFLNPNSSIHQNEPFSYEELSIMKWIAEIESDSLEVIVLKLVILTHFEINRSKFPIEYDRNEELFNTIIKKLTELKKVSLNYMMSIRELPEKYHIHRIFPEVIREELFEKVFSVVSYIGPDDEKRYKPSFRSMSGLMDAMGIDLDDTIAVKLGTSMDEKYNDDDFDFARRLFMWHGARTKDSYLGKIYCLFQNRDKWLEFWNSQRTETSRSFSYNNDVRDENINEYLNQHPEILEDCENFPQGIDFSLESTTTTANAIITTLLASSAKQSISDSQDEESKNQLEENFDFILELKEELIQAMETAKEQPDSNVNYFSRTLIDKITVLRNLNDSISDFIAEKRDNQMTEINLHNMDGKLRGFSQNLQTRIDENEISKGQSAAELGALIKFEISESTSSEDTHKVFESILSSMHQRKPKTFESLYKCILEESPASCIQKKFPQLRFDACKDLVSKSFIFFQRQNLIRYFEMIREKSQKLFNDPSNVPVDDLLSFCDELSKAKYFESRFENPVIVNFEFRSNEYFLKNEQVDDIKELTSIKDGSSLFKSIVIQRMMAAGKTLVLGTISIITKALKSSETLSILVPPSSLYQSNTTAMQSRTYNYFKKKGKNFMFYRFSINDEKLSKYLNTVIGIIENVMMNRDYLILSPESLHSFLNSYIEMLLYGDMNNVEHKEILAKYAKIYRIFKEQSSIILDEIDMTLDPKKELNFPTHEYENFNMTAVSLIADIMEFILFDNDIINNGLHIHSNNQASLTSEDFINCRNLILLYIKNQLNDENSLWYHLIFGKIKKDCSVEDIMKFLGDSDMSSEKGLIESFHESNSSIADTLIIIKAQLYRYMEDSFKGTVNFNYGSAGRARPGIKYAVPYVAANTPSNASVFADRWETLLKSLVMISATPCSEEIAKEVIKYVKTAILNESSVEETLDKTTTYKNLMLILPESISPLSLEETDAHHVKTLQKCLSSRTPAAIRILFDYLIKEVFAEMTFPIIQITSNALNMTSMFGSVQGYSGTIDNVNILPQETVKDAHFDHQANEKHNGGIALKLIKDGAKITIAIPELNESFFAKNIEEMVNELLGKFESNPISAVIDTGAFFKMFKNEQVAKAILKYYGDRSDAELHYEAVLYYDEDSNQLEFMKRDGTKGFLETTEPEGITKTTGSKLENRFTFYDQRHITGSDILQPVNAHAVMTVGPRVLLRDILQGTLRMRQFMRSQKVHLVTTEATKKFYNSKIGSSNAILDVSDLLTLGCINENEKQAQENQKLAFVKIDSEIRSFVLHEVSLILKDNESYEIAIKLFKSSNQLFIRQIRENPMSWLAKAEEKDTVNALKQYYKSRLSSLERLLDSEEFNDYPRDRFALLKETIEQMILSTRKSDADSLLYYLGDKIKERTGTIVDCETEVQMENQTETATQTLTETELNMYSLMSVPKSINRAENLVNTEKKLRSEKNRNRNVSSVAFDPEMRGTCNIKDITSLADLYLTHLARNPQHGLVSKTLLTDGHFIGLTRDLISPIESANPYSVIFSTYSLEGSHFFIDEIELMTPDNQKEKRLRVILLSTHVATEMFEALKSHLEDPDYRDKFWLCDLSGSITLSLDSQQRGESIYKLFPEISPLLFDLLVFNGSFAHILANPIQKYIYSDIWIRDEKLFKNRATFLLLRMKVLAEKDKQMFEESEQSVRELKSLAEGIQPSSENGIKSEGYQKDPIDPNVNTEIIRRMGLNVTDFEDDEPIIIDNNAIINSFFGVPKSENDNNEVVDDVDNNDDSESDDDDPFRPLKRSNRDPYADFSVEITNDQIIHEDDITDPSVDLTVIINEYIPQINKETLKSITLYIDRYSNEDESETESNGNETESSDDDEDDDILRSNNGTTDVSQVNNNSSSSSLGTGTTSSSGMASMAIIPSTGSPEGTLDTNSQSSTSDSSNIQDESEGWPVWIIVSLLIAAVAIAFGLFLVYKKNNLESISDDHNDL